MEKSYGYPDKPVASVGEDLFNVEVYVNALCSFVSGCDTPMTISIQGDWGSGKTSMMNMMKSNLEESVWPIWFNTWQFSQFDMGNSLAFSMMDVLLKGLDCDKDVRHKIIDGLIGFGKKAVKVVADSTVGGEFAGTIGELMEGDNSSDYAAEILELRGKFQVAVDEKLKKENKSRVVVFVDDLDRLQPSKAVELLEVLKLYLDCENCVFVLAVDYEVVTLGIKQKFGTDVSEEKGRSFFDKIIQLPFKMPVATYDIRKYVKGMMERLNIITDESEITLFYNLIQTSIGFNPRSMKRLFNTFELLDIVTGTTIKGVDESVRKRVLFGIICTQMCYEKMYLYFTSTKIDEDTFSALNDKESIMEAVKEIYGVDSGEKASPEMEKLCMFVPNLISAMQVDDDNSLSQEELDNFKAILKCSVVTSVNAVSEEESDSREWDYRSKNKDIVKAVARRLSDIGKFAAWMPRKERDGVKFSDISGWYTWPSGAGFNCCLEYYLSRLGNDVIGVSLYVSLSNGKGLEDIFFNMLGEDPLQLNMIPQKQGWGRYLYNNVLRVDANEADIIEQIEAITRKAYASLGDTINNHKEKEA